MSEPIPPPRKPGTTTWRKRARIAGIVLAGLVAVPATLYLAWSVATPAPDYPRRVWTLERQGYRPMPVCTSPQPSDSVDLHGAGWWPNPELMWVQLNPRPRTRRMEMWLFGWSVAASRDYRWTRKVVENKHGKWWEMELVDD